MRPCLTVFLVVGAALALAGAAGAAVLLPNTLESVAAVCLPEASNTVEAPGLAAGACVVAYSTLSLNKSPRVIELSCTSYGMVPRRVPAATIKGTGNASNS